jgi:hypothetical protein
MNERFLNQRTSSIIVTSEEGIEHTITLASEQGRKDFVSFMEKTVIPQLSKLSWNPFVRALSPI